MKKYLFICLFAALAFQQVYAQKQPYVILVSFDAFRWDYVNRGLTPNFDSVRVHGVSAISLRPCYPSSTFPNHYSIITGMYPENHGIIGNTIYDEFTKETYRTSDSTKVKNAKWYTGEAFWETAKRNGIITASYFWPGSELTLNYRRPDYIERYTHSRPFPERVNGVINWLKLPYNERPHFITLYFEATDDSGHKFGPDSIPVNRAIAKEDSMIGLLTSQLNSINMLDSTDIIFVSDHGMTGISKKRIINVESLLPGYKVSYLNHGPYMMLRTLESDKNKIYEKLLNSGGHFRVFTKENIPECYHFSSNPLIADIILIPDLGWSLIDDAVQKKLDKYTDMGDHGYDNHEMDMQGIFYAIGPDFKSGYRTGSLNNVDIYPLLCKLFNIAPRSNIDGKLENIEFILKGY